MKFIKISAFIATLISSLCIANTANILCLIDVISENSQMWNTVLFNALAAQGHSLTVVSTQWNKQLDDSIDYIDMQTTSDIKLLFDEQHSWLNTLLWYERVNEYCSGMLNPYRNKILQQLHFDMILYDVTYGSFCTFHMVQLWENASIVGISASKITAEIFEMVPDGIFNPAYVPHPQSLYSGLEKMHFLSRLYNTFLYGLNYFSRTILKNIALTKSIYGITHGTQNPLKKAIGRFKAILVNSDPSINYIQPLPPNVVEVGGLHIEEPKLLPNETNYFIDKMNKKIVYISLTDMKYNETIVAAIRLCSEYAFIWNIGYNAILKNMPENLHCVRKLSQNDILAHKKMFLFITRAEDMDIQDAVYHGVPIIALPQYAHQKDNAQRVHLLNFGTALSLHSLTSDQLSETIKSMEANPIFCKTMNYHRIIFRHQERKPLETAVWWIEEILAQPFLFDNLVSDKANDYNFFILHSWNILMLGLVFYGLCVTFSLLLLFLHVNLKTGTLNRILSRMPQQLKWECELPVESKQESEPKMELESESELESLSELEQELESESEVESGKQSGRESDQESEPVSEPQSKSEPESEPEPSPPQSESILGSKASQQELKTDPMPPSSSQTQLMSEAKLQPPQQKQSNNNQMKKNTKQPQLKPHHQPRQQLESEVEKQLQPKLQKLSRQQQSNSNRTVEKMKQPAPHAQPQLRSNRFALLAKDGKKNKKKRGTK